MNLSGIKSKIIVKKTEKLLKKQSKKSALKVSAKIKTVGIIVNQGSAFNFEMLKKLQKEIASGSDNFFVLTYKKNKDNFNEFRGVFFNENDLSWNGTIKTKEINTFITKPFDMLIDYTKANSVLKMYVAAKSAAKFKVGYANVDDRLYDLMIALENDDIHKFNKELIRYLKILNKL